MLRQATQRARLQALQQLQRAFASAALPEQVCVALAAVVRAHASQRGWVCSRAML